MKRLSVKSQSTSQPVPAPAPVAATTPDYSDMLSLIAVLKRQNEELNAKLQKTEKRPRLATWTVENQDGKDQQISIGLSQNTGIFSIYGLAVYPINMYPTQAEVLNVVWDEVIKVIRANKAESDRISNSPEAKEARAKAAAERKAKAGK